MVAEVAVTPDAPVVAATGGVVIRATFEAANSVNHMLPSGPLTIWAGPLMAVGAGNSWTVPVAGSKRPIVPDPEPWWASVNHSAPSGPVAMPSGLPLAVKPGVTPPVATSVIVPLGAIIPSRPGFANWANQTLPSGPGTMSRISPFATSPEENSVIEPVAGSRRPMALAPPFTSVNQRLPSAAALGVIELGSLPGVIPLENSVTIPSVEIRATALGGLLTSANQRLPSGPLAISSGPLFIVKLGDTPPVTISCTAPVVGLILPAFPGLRPSVNQS